MPTPLLLLLSLLLACGKVRHSARRLVQLAAEAAAGVAHLHAHGVIHRDLACRNLLVDEAAGCVAVADFGFARLRAKVKNAQQLLPQQLLPQQPNKQCQF